MNYSATKIFIRDLSSNLVFVWFVTILNSLKANIFAKLKYFSSPILNNVAFTFREKNSEKNILLFKKNHPIYWMTLEYIGVCVCVCVCILLSSGMNTNLRWHDASKYGILFMLDLEIALNMNIYIFTNLSTQTGCDTMSIFKWSLQVWILSLPSPRLVAIPRLKSPVFTTIYLLLKKEKLDSYSYSIWLYIKFV